MPASAGDARDIVQPLGQEDPWRRAWKPTPVFLPGEFHGQRSPTGHRPCSCQESDTTASLTRTRTHTESDTGPAVTSAVGAKRQAF